MGDLEADVAELEPPAATSTAVTASSTSPATTIPPTTAAAAVPGPNPSTPPPPDANATSPLPEATKPYRATESSAKNPGEVATAPFPQFRPSDLPSEKWRSTRVSIPRTFAVAGGLEAEVVTNHVPGYSERLDYLFYDEASFQVASSMPLPKPRDLSGYLPNEVFPSDHLAVIFDLQWRSGARH